MSARRSLRSLTRPVPLLALAALMLVPGAAAAQGAPEDYRRARALEETYAGLVVDVADGFRWSDDGALLTFRRSVEGGREFFATEAATGETRLAFDHERLAAGPGAVTGADYSAAPYLASRIWSSLCSTPIRTSG